MEEARQPWLPDEATAAVTPEQPGVQSPELTVRPTTGSLMLSSEVRERRGEAMEHFDELFAHQPYEVLMYASARLVVRDLQQRREVVRQLSSYGQAPQMTRSLLQGLEMFRAAHAKYTAALGAGRPEDFQTVLSREHNLVRLLTGYRDSELWPRPYGQVLDMFAQESRPRAGAVLRRSMYGMLRHYVRIYGVDADKLMRAISVEEVEAPELHKLTMPTERNWQAMAAQRPRMSDADMALLVRATPVSHEARRRVVEHFLPSLATRALRYSGDDRDEMLQLTAERVIRSALHFAQTDNDEPFEQYFRHVLRTYASHLSFARSTGRLGVFSTSEAHLEMRSAVAAREQLTAELGRPPSVRELAARINVSMERAWTLYSSSMPPEPFAEPDESWFAPHEPLSEPHKLPANERITIERALEFITPLKRRTLEQLHGFGGQPRLSYAEIGALEELPASAIRTRAKRSYLELRRTIAHMQAGRLFSELPRSYNPSVLRLYEDAAIPIMPDASLADLREEMGEIVRRLSQFSETDKDLLFRLYGMGGKEVQTREALTTEFKLTSERLRKLEHRLRVVLRGR
jgi:DNA-directed RNA polymerase specialized sigma24 family protein